MCRLVTLAVLVLRYAALRFAAKVLVLQDDPLITKHAQQILPGAAQPRAHRHDQVGD